MESTLIHQYTVAMEVTLFTLISIGQGFTRFFVANLVILHYDVFCCCECRIYALFCRECRDYALFGVEFYTEFWQKFSEILRILAEIQREKNGWWWSLWSGIPDLVRIRTKVPKMVRNRALGPDFLGCPWYD